MWVGSVQLSANQVAVTSADVTLPEDGQSVTLTVDALGLTLTLGLIERHHSNTNPDSVIGIEIVRRLPLDQNSFSVRVTLRSPIETECEAIWTAPEGTIFENTTLTTE